MGLEAGLALQREPVLKWGGAVATPRPHRALPKVGGPQTHLGTHGEPVPNSGGVDSTPIDPWKNRDVLGDLRVAPQPPQPVCPVT